MFEFPQNLMGYIGTLIFRGNRYQYKDAIVTHVKGNWGAVTLGKYIFADDAYFQDEETIKHEYGHRLQSKKLSVLYLLVIGLPSLIWAGCFEKWRRKHGISYYWFYTESWADKLGGVERNSHYSA
ncbi:MAG TPA: hypothetical protein GXX54_07030 [Clostridiales bacterium]|nr:hypothetical protein [Clostridiales bacterium]